MLVATWPGMTSITRTCGALIRRSSMSASENPFTANLAEEYAVCGTPAPSDAQKPLTLLVLTRTPSGLFISNGRKTRAQWYTPQKSTANTRSHISRGSLMKLPPPPSPALLNTRSTWPAPWLPAPCAARASSRNRATCASSATSHPWAVTVVPSGAPARASAAVSSAAAWRTSHASTAQPAAASLTTSSLPMPEPPPVTTASFPANEPMQPPPSRRKRNNSAPAPEWTASPGRRGPRRLRRFLLLSGVRRADRDLVSVPASRAHVVSVSASHIGHSGRESDRNRYEVEAAQPRRLL